MEKERKPEEFQDDRKKWNIYFDLQESPMEHNNSVVSVRFRRNKNGAPYLTEKDIEKLKQGLKDLGKFRIIKQGKEFLK